MGSMIQYCKEEESYGRSAWPDVIAFETCGICDKKEGPGTEAMTIETLEDHGYCVFLKHWMNTHLIRKRAISKSPHLRKWLDEIVCNTCKTNDYWPLSLNLGYRTICHRCEKKNLRNGNGAAKVDPWCLG